MPCIPFKHTMKDGAVVTGFICTSGSGKRCAICGRPSTKLCDGLKRDGKTCDLPLCRRCAVHVDPDKDYCAAHDPSKRKCSTCGHRFNKTPPCDGPDGCTVENRFKNWITTEQGMQS